MNFEIHHGGNSLNNVANLHVIMAIRNCEFFEVLLPAAAQKYGLVAGHRGRRARPRARADGARPRRRDRLRADRAEEDRGARLIAMAEAKTVADLIQDRFGLPTPAGAICPRRATSRSSCATGRTGATSPIRCPDERPRDRAGRGAVVAVEVGSAAGGHRVVRDRAKQAAIGALDPRHAVDRHGAALHGVLRRQPAHPAHRASCGAQPVPERHARHVHERRRRRGARDAGLHHRRRRRSASAAARSAWSGTTSRR